MNPLSLRRNFGWTLTGNLVYTACQWGMLTSIAKLGSPTMVGQFSLALAITGPVFIFTNLQLRSIQATDQARRFLFKDYFALRILGTLLGAFVVLGIVAYRGDREQNLVILALAVVKGLDALADTFYGYFQQNERMDRIARAMMANGIGALLSFSLILWLTSDLIFAALSLWTVSVLTLLWVGHAYREDASNAEKITHPIEPRSSVRLVHLFWLVLPLAVVMLLVSLKTNVPRYVIESEMGQRELGIFSALAYAVIAGTTVVSALGNSASPRLAKHYAEGDMVSFQALLKKLVLIGGVLGLGAVLLSQTVGEWFLSVLYTAEYAAFDDVLSVLAISGGLTFVGSFLGYGLTAARRIRSQLPVSIVVILVTVIGSFVLVPGYGLQGVAWAMVAGSGSQVLFSWVALRPALKGTDQNAAA